MAGRRPKPLAMHRLNGNPSMLNEHELSGADNPQPENGIPEMPKGMQQLARREWRAISKDLDRLGLLSKVDGKALMAYCEAYARWQETSKLIDKYGAVIQTAFEDPKSGAIIVGDLKANPAVAQCMQWLKVMKSFLIEFGLTPASRRNLKVNKATSDPMDDFLNRKRPAGTGPIPVPVKPEDMEPE